MNSDTLIRYDRITADRSERWLDLYYPDERFSVIDACINAEDEAQAMMNLADYSIDVSRMDERAIVELGKYVEVFIEESLNLETFLPYLITVKGDMGVRSVGSSIYRLAEDISMDRPEFMANVEVIIVYDEEESTLRPWLQGALVPRSSSNKLYPCRFPAEHLTSMRSVRSLSGGA